MKFNEGDIALIKPISKEGMVINFGLDLETHRYKYMLIVEKPDVEECDVYYCNEEDLVFITTFDEVIEDFKRDNKKDCKA